MYQLSTVYRLLMIFIVLEFELRNNWGKRKEPEYGYGYTVHVT